MGLFDKKGLMRVEGLISLNSMKCLFLSFVNRLVGYPSLHGWRCHLVIQQLPWLWKKINYFVLTNCTFKQPSLNRLSLQKWRFIGWLLANYASGQPKNVIFDKTVTIKREFFSITQTEYTCECTSIIFCSVTPICLNMAVFFTTKTHDCGRNVGNAGLLPRAWGEESEA